MSRLVSLPRSPELPCTPLQGHREETEALDQGRLSLDPGCAGTSTSGLGTRRHRCCPGRQPARPSAMAEWAGRDAVTFMVECTASCHGTLLDQPALGKGLTKPTVTHVCREALPTVAKSRGIPRAGHPIRGFPADPKMTRMLAANRFPVWDLAKAAVKNL